MPGDHPDNFSSASIILLKITQKRRKKIQNISRRIVYCDFINITPSKNVPKKSLVKIYSRYGVCNFWCFENELGKIIFQTYILPVSIAVSHG